MACCAALEGTWPHTVSVPCSCHHCCDLIVGRVLRLPSSRLRCVSRTAVHRTWADSRHGETFVERMRSCGSRRASPDHGRVVQALPKLLDSSLRRTFLSPCGSCASSTRRHHPWLSARGLMPTSTHAAVERGGAHAAADEPRTLGACSELGRCATCDLAHRESAWRHLRPSRNTRWSGSSGRLARCGRAASTCAARSPAVATRRARRAVGGASWRRVPTCSTTGEAARPTRS